MTIPFLGSRVIYPTRKDLETLLLSSDIDHPPSLSEMEPQTLNQLNALETGSVAFVYEGTKGKLSKRYAYFSLILGISQCCRLLAFAFSQ